MTSMRKIQQLRGVISNCKIATLRVDKVPAFFWKIVPMSSAGYVHIPACNCRINWICSGKILRLLASCQFHYDRAVFESVANQYLRKFQYKRKVEAFVLCHLDDIQMGQHVQIYQTQWWGARLWEQATKHAVPLCVNCSLHSSSLCFFSEKCR
jgi:hypothetical protein